MKKEVLIAIVSGLILGLVITFGIYTANRSIEKQKNAKKAQETPLPASPSPSLSQKTLTITSPENYDLINQRELTINGIAWPEAVIAIITENSEFFTQADNEGYFLHKLNLVKGYNEITVIATDELNSTQTQNLVVTYSTNKIELEDEESEE